MILLMLSSQQPANSETGQGKAGKLALMRLVLAGLKW